MIVAWQFTAWNMEEKVSPSRRDGLISWSWCGFISISRPAKLNHTVPNGTERFLLTFPRQ
jgi:hypothetical protein